MDIVIGPLNTDMPTEEYDGIKLWKLDGRYHRVGGPALMCDTGISEWYLYGKLHRTDGPAVIWHDKNVEWWLEGQEYNFHMWLRINKSISDEEKFMIVLNYG